MFAKMAARLNRMRDAARFRSVPNQIIDLVTHKVRLNIAPYDYYSLEFYKSGKTWDEKSRYVGKYGSAYWPFESNPLRYNPLFTNKYIEKLLLKGAGLPTAQLLAIVGENGDIRSKEDLVELLQRLPHDVVVKPVSGTHGKKVLVLAHGADGFRSGDKPWTEVDVWNHVRGDLQRGFLIEEKLVNSAEIAALYPRSLNTLRVVTVKTLDKRWCLAAAYLRVGAGGRVVDNISAGGILVRVDEDGRTRSAHQDGRSITDHPDTGAALIGVRLEGYRAACALALEASRKLGFVGTIGWDIAATDRGPVIVEANLWWTPSFQAALGGAITDELAASLPKRALFARWDRSMMYPHFDKRKRRS